jgi:putative CocE/NonD family hydrolase
MAREYMVGDNRHAARRPDVLTYQTDVLENDLTLVGPIEVRLRVATTGTDADFIVKLIDVHPDDAPDPEPNPAGVRMGGYQQLVRGDVMRGRFRRSFEKPEPFVPNQPTEVSWTLPDVCHTFRTGHRLMVQVQSTWFPLVDRNPQTFVPNIFEAKPEDFRKATHRVFHDSLLRVPIMP